MPTGLPPWLDFSPSLFVQAKEAGLRLGQSQQQIHNDRIRIANEASQAAAALAQRGQELAAQQKANALRAKIEQEQLQNNFLTNQSRQAIASAYNEARIGLRRNQLERTAADKSAEIADRIGYANAIANGETPASALQKFPRAWAANFGANLTGTSPGSNNSETVTEIYPAEPAQPEIPGKPGTPDKTRAKYNPARYIFGETIPGTPPVPAIPGHPATPERRVTYKVPRGTIADDYQNAGGNLVAPMPAQSERVTRSGDNQIVQPGPRQFTDKSGTVYNYIGKADDPITDKNPDNWQLASESESQADAQ